MKKFVNDPQQFVPEMLKGIQLANPRQAQVRARVQPDHAGRRPQREQGVDREGYQDCFCNGVFSPPFSPER